MVILGCPFLNTSEKLLMSLLINQSNIFKKQLEFSIKKERLLFCMGIKKRALIDIVRKKLIPKGLIIDFKENSSNFDVILGDYKNNPLIILTGKILELMQPKKRKFNSTQEKKIWTIFSNLKIDDIAPILQTHEDIELYIKNLLDTKKIDLPDQKIDNTVKINYNSMAVRKWYLNELCDYFFDEYKRVTGNVHPPIREEQREDLMHKVWNYYATSQAINTKKHIDVFLETYSKKVGFDPKLQLLGNYENIYQIDFYIKHRYFPNEYQKTKKEQLSSEDWAMSKSSLSNRQVINRLF